MAFAHTASEQPLDSCPWQRKGVLCFLFVLGGFSLFSYPRKQEEHWVNPNQVKPDSNSLKPSVPQAAGANHASRESPPGQKKKKKTKNTLWGPSIMPTEEGKEPFPSLSLGTFISLGVGIAMLTAALSASRLRNTASGFWRPPASFVPQRFEARRRNTRFHLE